MPIAQMDRWVSPRLGIRFDWQGGEPELFYPDGQRFLSSIQLDQWASEAEAALEQERQRAERLVERLRGLGLLNESADEEATDL